MRTSEVNEVWGFQIVYSKILPERQLLTYNEKLFYMWADSRVLVCHVLIKFGIFLIVEMFQYSCGN